MKGKLKQGCKGKPQGTTIVKNDLTWSSIQTNLMFLGRSLFCNPWGRKTEKMVGRFEDNLRLLVKHKGVQNALVWGGGRRKYYI